MTTATPRRPARARTVSAMVEDIVGCKWSLSVLAAVREGIHRPGAIQRSLAGLSAKVMNERLRKLTRYGILERRSFAEIPPRVEYHVTAFGHRFGELIDGIERLQQSLEGRRPTRGRTAGSERSDS